MRQARLDLYAPPPADLPTIRTCAACGYLRYVALDCFGCESADKPIRKPVLPRVPSPPLAPLPPIVAPEPLLRHTPPSPPERRPPGREICDPLPSRRQAWRKAAG
jgi:hypothetical protein